MYTIRCNTQDSSLQNYKLSTPFIDHKTIYKGLHYGLNNLITYAHVSLTFL